MAHPNPRFWQYQAEMLFRKRVNYNDAGIASAVYIGTAPAGAIITSTKVMVNTAFNAGTNNSLTVGGNSANYNDIVSAGGYTNTTGVMTTGISPTGSSLGSLSADRDIYVMYAQTGTAATAGSADIIISYAINNDQ